MNNKRAKSLRRFVRQRLPFLQPDSVYGADRITGVLRLSPVCFRYHYQNIKRNYKTRSGLKASAG